MSDNNFNKRAEELKGCYGIWNGFDITTILNLEDEYNHITKNNPTHTKKREEILTMRCRLLDTLGVKDKCFPYKNS